MFFDHGGEEKGEMKEQPSRRQQRAFALEENSRVDAWEQRTTLLAFVVNVDGHLVNVLDDDDTTTKWTW